jgi:hypothetical protein
VYRGRGELTWLTALGYSKQELLEYCVRERPAVLLLMGPFVDAEHPAIGNGQLDITFDDLFAAQVAISPLPFPFVIQRLSVVLWHSLNIASL